jgi:hypothetical protein
MDRVIYWIEYVIRYKGASHLRTSSRKFSLYQRLLLDVMFVFLVGGIILFYLRLFRYVFHKRSSQRYDSKKKN